MMCLSLLVQILHDVLDKIPFSFAIRLAALASQKELLDLEKWLSISLVTDDGSFLEVFMLNADHRVISLRDLSSVLIIAL